MWDDAAWVWPACCSTQTGRRGSRTALNMHTSGTLLDDTQAGSYAVCWCAVLVHRNAGFLSNVEAELTQQLLRIGSHASMVVFGGNNEVEQSLDWYKETASNVAMYAADYSALFEHTIAPLVQKVGLQKVVGVPGAAGGLVGQQAKCVSVTRDYCSLGLTLLQPCALYS